MKENYRASEAAMINMWSANEIRSMINYKEKKIILLKPVSDEEPLDNIFCIDGNNIVWQVEDVKKKYPNNKKMPYENLFYHDGILTASTFMGVGYDINPDTGKIISLHIVK